MPMSTINTILIRRRLEGSTLNTVPSLSGGELAYSEKNHTLYYGGEFGTLTIAGSGAFVDVLNTQTISGPKTFTGATTVGDLTVSASSTVDFGSNVLTNLGTPVNDADATTKLYVDTVATGASTATDTLSAEIYNTFVKLTDDRAVDLSGGLTVSSGINADTVTTTGNVSVGGNLTVVGDLEVQGNVTSLETTTTVTSAFSITNAGTTEALTVTQTGSTDVAVFYDDANTALIIKDGGNVGIGTATPSEKLSVEGNVYVNGTLTVDGGNIYTDGAGNLTLLGSISTDGGTISSNGGGDLTTANINTGNVTAVAVTTSYLNADTGDTSNLAIAATGTTSLDSGSITTDGSGNITTSGNITGNGTTTITNFVIDGGSF